MKLKQQSDTDLGKFISLILRHKPEAMGITLDKNGWADTKQLIEGINASGRYIDMEILERIVRENNKKRHGKPVILVIDVEKMVREGYSFWLSDNGVWQSEDIKWKYVKEILSI